MRAHIPRVAVCGLAALLVAAGNEPTATVTVDGVAFSYQDMLQLSGLAIGAGDFVHGGIVKQPSEMPKTSPYVYFAGTDAGGKPIVRVSSVVQSGTKLSSAEMAEISRESEQAGLTAAIATGKGNDAVQRLYSRVKSDPGALASLGAVLTRAMSEMSEKTVQYANTERRWIFRNIPAGMQRARAENTLREHQLVATEHGDTTVVSLPGAFEPGCYFSTNVTLTFSNQQLYKIDLSRPIPDCL